MQVRYASKKSWHLQCSNCSVYLFNVKEGIIVECKNDHKGFMIRIIYTKQM